MIHVGLTERHGMAVEQSQFAPEGVTFSFLTPTRLTPPLFLRSPIKGYMQAYDYASADLIEAIISPVITSRPWIYSCENLHAAIAFSLLRIPLPPAVRIAFIRRLLLKPNCKKVVFWSRAGFATLHSYAGLAPDDELVRKSTVVYPAVRAVPDRLVRFNDGSVRFFFSGDFFRKGGVNVLDAFERARAVYPNLTLVLCCDERIDFNTPNSAMRTEYLHKAKTAPGVEFLGRISRDRMLEDVLPGCDVFLLPTYAETFGMSILEAMAYGIPVVATNHFAIPEMVTHEETGLLIDVSRFDTERTFKGYVVDQIPQDFRDHVTGQLFGYMCALVESPELRRRLGAAALARARTQFSFAERNRQMQAVYQEAVGQQ